MVISISLAMSSGCANKMDFSDLICVEHGSNIAALTVTKKAEFEAAEQDIKLAAPDKKELRCWYTEQRVKPFQRLDISPYAIRHPEFRNWPRTLRQSIGPEADATDNVPLLIK